MGAPISTVHGSSFIGHIWCGFVTDAHGPNGARGACAESELDRLIAEQEQDLEHGDRVWGISVDQFASGAEVILQPRRLLAHDDRHGTLYCYTRLKCRCKRCRAANAAYARRAYHLKRLRLA